MKLWLDAQLSPSLAPWLKAEYGLEVLSVQEYESLVSAKDRRIFREAGAAGAAVMTKDRDFVDLVERLGPPPQVLWVTCGNTSNRALRDVLRAALPGSLELLKDGEPLVEIGGQQ